jgi:hypothetical protein
MTFATRRITCALLVTALAVPASFATAADDRDSTVTAAAPAPGLRASIDRAARAAVAPLPSRSVALQSAPPPAYPLTTKRDRSLKQGGGGGMMVMGIIGTLAGLAGTYYMIKMMKDQQKDADAAQ